MYHYFSILVISILYCIISDLFIVVRIEHAKNKFLDFSKLSTVVGRILEENNYFHPIRELSRQQLLQFP